jgi:hypothetical protein
LDGLELLNCGYATGYVLGVLDAESETTPLPEGITQGQAVLIVNKYIADHPERLQESAAVLVKDAMQAAYPKMGADDR